MAFVVRTYECDSGGEAEPHRFEVMLASGEHPKFCLQCGAEVADGVLPIPAKVSIGGSPIARSTDQTYRLLETSSAARAAELNAPALKVNDMKDGLREGDVAAKGPPVSAEFALFERERRALGYPSFTGFGGGFAGMAQPGARVAPTIAGGSPGQRFAGPGHIAMAGIQPDHEARVQDVVARPTHQPYVRGR